MIYELSLMHYLLANVTLNLFLIIVVNCLNFERFIVEICYILLPLFQNYLIKQTKIIFFSRQRLHTT